MRPATHISFQAAALVAIALTLLALSPSPVRAQGGAAEDAAADAVEEGATSGDALTISVLTFGPGDHPFEKFGHNGILIEDAVKRRGQVYNFGTFSFSSIALVPQFFMGRFRYWLSRRTLDATVYSYRKHNRSIVSQELELTGEQKLSMRRRLEVNLRRENRYYKYDYYRDNCSTRVRDLIDDITGGRVREAARGPGSMTLRRHTSRLVAGSLPEYVVLNAMMGPLIDQPIDEWAEMFLPAKLSEGLRRATVPAPGGAPGEAREPAEFVPLVREEKVLFAASRPPPLDVAPSFTAWFALVGVGIGGALALLGHAGRARRPARVTLGALLAAIGLTLGFFGCFSLFLWGFTDHAVAYRNWNLLLFAPWSIALVGYGVGVARGRPRAARVAFALTAAAAGAAGLGLLLRLPSGQENDVFIALLLPVWVGAAAGLRRLRGALAAGQLV